jgi:hypothetical protein
VHYREVPDQGQQLVSVGHGSRAYLPGEIRAVAGTW